MIFISLYVKAQMKRSMQGLFLTERALKKEAERRLGIKDAEGSFGAGLLNGFMSRQSRSRSR